MLSVEDAQSRLLDAVQPLPAEWVSLAGARRRRLALSVSARRDQPPFAASAMDGYAIRWADLPGPWQVVGEAAAGRRSSKTLGRGEAIRIFTGAPLPANSDSVVIQENTTLTAGLLTLIGAPPKQGANVRRAGLDFSAGDELLPAGAMLTAGAIGLAAAAGHATLAVHRRPRVGLLATGDELVPPGAPPGPDQIVNSNNAMLAALLSSDADIVDAGIARDDPAAIEAGLHRLSGCDVIVTIGGASVGDHDLIQPVLRALGATIDFWKVAVRPGKPMLFGRLAGAHLIGLPGNPVSAFVCATLFVLPMLRRMNGDRLPLPAVSRAPLGKPLPANGDRRDHLRAMFVEGDVVPASTQDSSMLRVLAAANALIVRYPNAPPAEAGTLVDCIAI